MRFDPSAILPYTARVRHLVAIIAGVAFAAAPVQWPALHTHAYVAHDHPEHAHAPAAHEHPQPAPHHDDEDEDEDAVHLESCEPGQHVVSVTASCPPLPRVGVFDAQAAQAGGVHRLVLLRSAHSVTDVRVHGPPPRAQASPRAPPLITLPA